MTIYKNYLYLLNSYYYTFAKTFINNFDNNLLNLSYFYNYMN